MKPLVFLFLCCFNYVFAQDTLLQSALQLQEAVNIALQNSYDIQLAKNDVRINTTYNNIGVAGGLPVVSGAVQDREQVTSLNQKYSDATRNVTRNNAASNNFSSSVDGSFLLYNGMRVKATKKRLEELQSQSEERLNSQIQNTIADIMINYFDVVRQQSYIKTIDQSITVARQKLLIIETQKSVGLANNADLFQAQIDLSALEQSRQSQQLVIDQTKTELLRLMNLNTDSTIAIADTIIADNTLTLDAVLERLPANADIIAAQRQVRINELLTKETAAQRYPSVTASGGYTYGRTQNAAGFTLLNQSYGPYLSLGVSIPIYNGSVYRRQQRVAEINTQSADIQRRALERDYKASIIKNFQAYITSLQQLEAERRIFDTAQQLLNIVIQRFQLRVNTIVEVREAEQSFQNEAFRLVNLSFAAKAAEIEMKRLANILAF
ncbi:TolC family protein [Ilyomonas limi]|uniref:TolC family protein n=1 Tax=Ilyomonas limi TaxID=2575867 RepID=A0A4U3KXC7_9BACT|nr:TolC family protein [Ilyomonas limi]TKK67265.1 TolC family protein [Ilyomonas limi]